MFILASINPIRSTNKSSKLYIFCIFMKKIIKNKYSKNYSDLLDVQCIVLNCQHYVLPLRTEIAWDVSNAFDRVCNRRLLYKLASYCIRSSQLSCPSSLVCPRRVVVIGQFFKSMRTIRSSINSLISRPYTLSVCLCKQTV